MASRLSEIEYLRRIEALAARVRDEASKEGWLSYAPDSPDVTALQRTINELARNLRHTHHAGDGCVDE